MTRFAIKGMVLRSSGVGEGMAEQEEPEDSEAGVQSLWYFAYGANLDRETFVERRRIEPIEEIVGYVEDFALVFDQVGLPLLEPTFANLRATPGEVVHGVAYRVTESQLEELDMLEGGGAYLHLEVPFHSVGRPPVMAKTYIAKETREGRFPSRRYMGLILRGARAHGLPDEWIQRLEGQRTGGLPGSSGLARLIMRLFEWRFRARHERERERAQ